MTDATLERLGFWFLRHGETDWNAQNLSQGNVDIPLNATGLAQARAAAAKLVGRGIATIIASPVSRARVTAEIVAEVLALPIHYDDGLREAAYGVREGQPMTEWFQQWVDGVATPEGAEPFADLRRRAVAAINRSLGQPAPVLVIAHGGLFRAVRAAMGLEPNIRTPNATPYWCEPADPHWLLTAAA
jgi:probable phosphoglycerate mutase